MSDQVYSYERAGFSERAAKLAGGTTFREPMGGHGTKTEHLPDAHAIATAFAYARLAPHDIGPDIAVAIITGTTAHQQKIVSELAAALMVALGRSAQGHGKHIIRIIAADCYLRVVTGTGVGKPAGMGDRPYEIARLIGDSILWRAADEAMFRAERAYRQEPKAIAETA